MLGFNAENYNLLVANCFGCGLLLGNNLIIILHRIQINRKMFNLKVNQFLIQFCRIRRIKKENAFSNDALVKTTLTIFVRYDIKLMLLRQEFLQKITPNPEDDEEL